MAKYTLGPLERQILEIIWRQNQVSVGQLIKLLSQKRKPAYTTITTIVGRLVEKGLLRKQKKGKFCFYKPKYTRCRFVRRAVHKFVSQLVGYYGESAVVAFLDEANTLSDSEKDKLIEKLK